MIEDTETTEEVVSDEEAGEVEDSTTSEEEETVEEVEEDSTTSEEETPAKKSGVQKRINELTKQRYEAESRAEEAERKLRESEQPKEALPDRPVKVSLKDCDYDDDLFEKKTEEYIDALTSYNVAVQFAKESEKAKHDQWAKDFKSKQESFLNVGREKYDDFDDVVNDIPKSALNIGVVEDILGTENSEKIAYYLGSNIEEAVKISKMQPRQRAIHLGRLDEKLSKVSKKITSASGPISPVKTRGKGPIKEEDLSMDEWVKLRRDGKIK